MAAISLGQELILIISYLVFLRVPFPGAAAFFAAGFAGALGVGFFGAGFPLAEPFGGGAV